MPSPLSVTELRNHCDRAPTKTMKHSNASWRSQHKPTSKKFHAANVSLAKKAMQLVNCSRKWLPQEFCAVTLKTFFQATLTKTLSRVCAHLKQLGKHADNSTNIKRHQNNTVPMASHLETTTQRRWHDLCLWASSHRNVLCHNKPCVTKQLYVWEPNYMWTVYRN